MASLWNTTYVSRLNSRHLGLLVTHLPPLSWCVFPETCNHCPLIVQMDSCWTHSFVYRYGPLPFQFDIANMIQNWCRWFCLKLIILPLVLRMNWLTVQKGALPFMLTGFWSISSKATEFSLKLVLSSKLTHTGSLCRLEVVSLRSGASVQDEPASSKSSHHESGRDRFSFFFGVSRLSLLSESSRSIHLEGNFTGVLAARGLNTSSLLLSPSDPSITPTFCRIVEHGFTQGLRVRECKVRFPSAWPDSVVVVVETWIIVR